MFDAYLSRWNLTPDGAPIVTHAARLLPVLHRGQPAMLKVSHEEDEKQGGVLMRWWDGHGAARVLAHDDEAIVLERATGGRSLAEYARNGRDDEATRIICGVLQELHAPRPKPLPELRPLQSWFADLWPAARARGGILAESARHARVLLDSPVPHLDRLFDYLVPPRLDAAAGIGTALLDLVKARRSGGFCLWVFETNTPARGGWRGAAALFVYAAAFSYAYVQLDAGTGALLLFGAVQVTLLLAGLLRGERLGGQALLGFLLALGGLLFLLLPGASAPPLGGALLMLLSGLAWGLYTLLGRGGGDPLAVSAGNFLRALAFAALLLLAFHGQLRLDGAGLAYALLSGALASGLGYAVWYSALPGLTAIQGASVQLSVPVLAALCGALLLGEPLAPRLPPATLAVLGGIALILAPRLGRAAREGA